LTRDYQEVNRRAWTHLVNRGYPSTQPYGPHHFAHARELLDPHGWIPWDTIENVLCLGAGGGQQVPLLASLDCRVTAVDLCPDQVERDRAVAAQYGLEVELIEGDILDLTSLHGRGFDLVYQALSACYVPDVRRLYQEVARVIKAGGYYRVEHANPVTMQLSDRDAWNGTGYCLVRPQQPGEPVPWAVPGEVELESSVTCWHYIHPMDHLVGGLGDAGFVLLHFAERAVGDMTAEPGTYAHLAAYVPPFFTLVAQLGSTR
jgi:SAM-dependent methyltransferase